MNKDKPDQAPPREVTLSVRAVGAPLYVISNFRAHHEIKLYLVIDGFIEVDLSTVILLIKPIHTEHILHFDDLFVQNVLQNVIGAC